MATALKELCSSVEQGGGRGRGKLGELRLAGVTLGTFAPFFFFFFSYTVIAAIGHLAGSSIMVEL